MNSCSWISPLAAAIVAWITLSGCATNQAHRPLQPAARVSGITAEVNEVLSRQVAAWNAGDIPAFMDGYDTGSATRFASGGSVTRGWATVLARYRDRYKDRRAMGILTFSDLEFSVLADDAVLAFGHWRLQRDADHPGGLFTLLFRKTAGGWRIVHDHTSSEDPK